MNCRTPFERYVQVGWLESTANTGFVVSNRTGAEFIALGSQDTVGGVLIVPSINNSTGLKAFIVTPEAPFVGFIDGPFQVLPLYTLGVIPSYAFATAPVLDLLVYERQPPFFPSQRSPLYFSKSIAAATADTINLNVRGRRQVIVTISAESYPAAGTWVVSALVGGSSSPGTPGATGLIVAYDEETYATPGAIVRASFNNTLGLDGNNPGSPMLDRLSIALDDQNADGVEVVVQAWD
jgi:hypothetical protein